MEVKGIHLDFTKVYNVSYYDEHYGLHFLNPKNPQHRIKIIQTHREELLKLKKDIEDELVLLEKEETKIVSSEIKDQMITQLKNAPQQINDNIYNQPKKDEEEP